MFNFTGQIKPQRNINLSGSKDNNNRGSSSVLDSIRLNRMERQKDKLKSNSTFTIQRIYRGYITRKTVIKDAKLKLKQTIKKFVQVEEPSTKMVFDLVVSFILSKNKQEEISESVVNLLVCLYKEMPLVFLPFGNGFKYWDFALMKLSKVLSLLLPSDKLTTTFLLFMETNNISLAKRSSVEVIKNGYLDKILESQNLNEFLHLLELCLIQINNYNATQTTYFVEAIIRMMALQCMKSALSKSSSFGKNLGYLFRKNQLIMKHVSNFKRTSNINTEDEIQSLLTNFMLIKHNTQNENDRSLFDYHYLNFVNSLLEQLIYTNMKTIGSEPDENDDKIQKNISTTNYEISSPHVSKTLTSLLLDNDILYMLKSMVRRENTNASHIDFGYKKSIEVVSKYVVLIFIIFNEDKIKLNTFLYKLLLSTEVENELVKITFEYINTPELVKNIENINNNEQSKDPIDISCFIFSFFLLLVKENLQLLSSQRSSSTYQTTKSTISKTPLKDIDFEITYKILIQSAKCLFKKEYLDTVSNFIKNVTQELLEKIHELQLTNILAHKEDYKIQLPHNLINEIVEYLYEQSNMPQQHQKSLAPIKATIKYYSDIINNLPFLISFEQRNLILRNLIQTDKIKLNINPYFYRINTTIRRTHIFEDGFNSLNLPDGRLKTCVKITFVNEFGLHEEGIDGGGVFKEFMNNLLNQALDPNYGLFVVNDGNFVYPKPGQYSKQKQQLEQYSFLGRLIGKSIYEDTLMDVKFATFFLSKITSKRSTLNDISTVDSELYKGLMKLKNYEGDVEKDFGLNFTIDQNDFGVLRSIDLVKNGSQISVTNSNRLEYVYLVCNYHLNYKINKQCSHILKGIDEIVPLKWLRMFNQNEIQLIMSGTDAIIDINEMINNVVYSGEYTSNHPTIVMFWEVVKEMNNERVRKLLRFITSCPNLPLSGFKYFEPKICIQNSSDDQQRLPSASTCLNLLKLPQYNDINTLREKLLYCIDSNSGFELS